MVSSEWEDGIKSGLMSVTGKSVELGDVTTDLEVAYNGPDRAFAYKSEYLRDTLTAMSKLSSSLILKFNRASQATAVSVQDGALSLMSVIIPLTIPDTSYADAVGHSYPRIDQYPGETDKQQLDLTQARNEYTEWEKANLPLTVRARKVQQDKPAWGPDDGAQWYEDEYRRWWRDTFTVQPAIPVLPAAPAKDYGSPRPKRRTVHSPKNSRFYVPPVVMTAEQTEVAKQERDRFEARTEYTRWCTDRGVERRWLSDTCPAYITQQEERTIEWYEQAYPHLSTVITPAAAPLEPATDADYTAVHEMLSDHYAPAEIAL